MKTFLQADSINPYIRYVNDLDVTFPHEVARRVIFDHEFIFCLQGEACMEYQDKLYHIEAGDLFYLLPDIQNYMYLESPDSRKSSHRQPRGRFHAHCVHFDWCLVAEEYNFTVDQVYVPPSAQGDSVRLIAEKLCKRPLYELADPFINPLTKGLDFASASALFRELYLCFKTPGLPSRIRQKSLFLEIISLLFSHTLLDHDIPGGHYHYAAIHQSIEYMKARCQDKITTPLLASRAGLSPKYFGTIFKSITSKSVQEYLTEIRLQKGRELLTETTLPITEIADSIGICDVYYFTKLFKAKEGITPSRYRKMLCYR